MTSGKLKFYLTLSKFAVKLSPGTSKTEILNNVETINYLTEHPQLSLIRLGDGEFRILLKRKDVHYQPYSDKLRCEMLEFMKDYQKNDNSQFLLAVPYKPFYNDKKWLLSHSYKYLMSFGIYRLYFRWFMNKKKIYGDAFAFGAGYENAYHKLWENSELVIFVHNDEKYANAFESKYGIETRFVKIPSNDCYKEIDLIQKSIESIALNTDKKYTILISAGPCGKVLVNRLRKKNIVSYDTGHCWDEPLEIKES